MSETGIKLIIILAAVAVCCGVRYVSYFQEDKIVIKAAEDIQNKFK